MQSVIQKFYSSWEIKTTFAEHICSILHEQVVTHKSRGRFFCAINRRFSSGCTLQISTLGNGELCIWGHFYIQNYSNYPKRGLFFIVISSTKRVSFCLVSCCFHCHFPRKSILISMVTIDIKCFTVLCYTRKKNVKELWGVIVPGYFLWVMI